MFSPIDSIQIQYSVQYSAIESLYTTYAGITENYKAPLPGKMGHRSGGSAIERAWAIPALCLLDLSKASDIPQEHSPNAAQLVHCVRIHCSPTSYCAWMMWQCLNRLFIDYMINPELSPASGLNSSSAVTIKKKYLWQPLNHNAGSNRWMHAGNARSTVSTVSLRYAQVSA